MKNDEQNYDLCTERNVTSIEKLAFIGHLKAWGEWKEDE